MGVDGNVYASRFGKEQFTTWAAFPMGKTAFIFIFNFKHQK
jgi:hypothetical protein